MTNSANNFAPRMHWLDGARIAAAFCIVGIHTSSDNSGAAFATSQPHDIVFPMLMRSISEMATTEFFILVSLFLLALKKESPAVAFVSTMAQKAKRLLVPFLFWTLFYAFFRLYKATQFGYEHIIFDELSAISHWVGYFILGNANYHLHFLPTLFFLMLFHRLFRLATVFPLLGLIIVPMLYVNNAIGEWIWGTIDNPVLREYTVRFVKVITYTGYGFFAYSLAGFWQRGIPQEYTKSLFGMGVFLLSIGFLFSLMYAQKAGIAGEYIVRADAIFYSHYLLQCVLLFAFMSSFYLRWPDGLGYWSRYTFGVYLIHPAVLDVLEVAFKDLALQPDWAVFIKYCLTAVLSLFVTIAIGRISLLAWTVGLGPFPHFGKSTVNLEPKTLKVS